MEVERKETKEGEGGADSPLTCHDKVGGGLPSAVQVKVGTSPSP